MEAVVVLGRADLERRHLLRASVYSLAALALPDWADIEGRGTMARTGGNVRIGHGEVDAVVRMSQAFGAADDAYGGGHARSAVAAYLSTDVAAFLRCDAPDPVRRALHTATADLLYLAGWMAWDDQANGLAQHYYSVAARMAVDADDAPTYAVVLRGMSVQALQLGHPQHALHLAEAARSAAKDAPARTTAFIEGQIAAATAAIGDRRRALTHLATAERNLGQATSDATISGGYHQAALDYQTGQILTAADDLAGAELAYRASNRHRPTTEHRSQAITLTLLADVQLSRGHLEAACATWQEVHRVSANVRSARIRVAAANACGRLRPHLANPTAAATYRLTRALAREPHRV